MNTSHTHTHPSGIQLFPSTPRTLRYLVSAIVPQTVCLHSRHHVLSLFHSHGARENDGRHHTTNHTSCTHLQSCLQASFQFTTTLFPALSSVLASIAGGRCCPASAASPVASPGETCALAAAAGSSGSVWACVTPHTSSRSSASSNPSTRRPVARKG